MTRARLPTKLAKRARERSEPAGGFLEAHSRSEFVERGERGSPQSSRSERVSEANPLATGVFAERCDSIAALGEGPQTEHGFLEANSRSEFVERGERGSPHKLRGRAPEHFPVDRTAIEHRIVGARANPFHAVGGVDRNDEVLVESARSRSGPQARYRTAARAKVVA